MRNLLAAIDGAKERPLARLLTALGIDHVGGTVARSLAAHFRSLPVLMKAGEAEITAIEGIGPEIARSVVEWAQDQDNADLVQRLGAAGVRLVDPEPDDKTKQMITEKVLGIKMQ